MADLKVAQLDGRVAESRKHRGDREGVSVEAGRAAFLKRASAIRNSNCGAENPRLDSTRLIRLERDKRG